jgi:hypothetical protein
MATQQTRRDFGRLLLVWLALACALLLLGLRSAHAATDSEQSTLNVTVPVVLSVTYTGNLQLVFVVTTGDISAGYKILTDHGNLNWMANKQPWVISVKRGVWTRDGDGGWNKDPRLYVRTDKPGSTDWFEVQQYFQEWLHGTTRGTGSYNGVDWKLKIPRKEDGDDHDHGQGNDKFQTGTYRNTVTFTMGED